MWAGHWRSTNRALCAIFRATNFVECVFDAMSLFALIAALMLEQLHPLSSRKYLYSWLSGYVDYFQHHFNTGQHKHGKIAWLLAVVPLLVGVLVAYWLLHRVHPILAWAFNVLALYITMGFRQFSHYFTDIQQALRDDKLDEARSLLSKWRGIPAHELNAEEVARVTIEEALLASHRNVFGVIVWFVLFSALGLGGAAGALLYRLGQFLSKHWSEEAEVELKEFGRFARRAFYFLNWLPIRMTAATFAIVGDFEDTVYCWLAAPVHWGCDLACRSRREACWWIVPNWVSATRPMPTSCAAPSGWYGVRWFSYCCCYCC